MEINERVVGDVTILDMDGRLALEEGDRLLRDKVKSVVSHGRTLLVLNLAAVPYVDSAGLGQIVRTYTTLSREGGRLRLLHANKRLVDLLSVTKLLSIFELFDSEAEALRGFEVRVAGPQGIG
jgi:anti-sigma B factor antagonist